MKSSREFIIFFIGIVSGLLSSFFIFELSINYLSNNSEHIRNISLGLAAILGVPVLIWRAYIADKEKDIKNASDVANRFGKAIEQMGNESLAIRVGSIYSLEKIIKEHPEEHQRIIEILASMIREPLKYSSGEGQLQERINQLDSDSIKNVPCRAADIYAALKVIGRRNSALDNFYQKIDLNMTMLYGALLQEMDFSNTILFRSILRRSGLSNINLNNSDLKHADFTSARLSNAILLNTKIDETKFNNAHLDNVDFKGAEIGRADFRNASLIGADLSSCDLSRSIGITEYAYNNLIIKNRDTIQPEEFYPEAVQEYED